MFCFFLVNVKRKEVDKNRDCLGLSKKSLISGKILTNKSNTNTEEQKPQLVEDKPKKRDEENKLNSYSEPTTLLAPMQPSNRPQKKVLDLLISNLK